MRSNKRTYYILLLVLAIIAAAFFFFDTAYAQVDTGEITVTSSTVANILPVSIDSDYLTSLPSEDEPWRADRIAVLVDAAEVGEEPMFQPDSVFLAELDSLLNAAQAKIIEQQGTIEAQAAEIVSKDAEIVALRDSIAPLEQQIVDLEALVAEYEEGIAIARQSIGQFQQWLRDFDSQ